MEKMLNVELKDNEWELEYIDHDREIVRAIVFDENGFFYFVRATRNDDFGNVVIIETAGGGVEPNEDYDRAIVRELREELGAEVEILCKIGTVSDYYNMIHRHNINNYYLCKVRSFEERHLTEDEEKHFHLTTLKLTYDEALREYEKCKENRLGRLIAQREVPILRKAKEMIDDLRGGADFTM
ncbi:MAG: NUDIX hydrolase [Muribaculaceae bacterium]|nr:NUDIX hydrolase [Muribaculaceae bacterium]